MAERDPTIDEVLAAFRAEAIAWDAAHRRTSLRRSIIVAIVTLVFGGVVYLASGHWHIGWMVAVETLGITLAVVLDQRDEQRRRVHHSQALDTLGPLLTLAKGRNQASTEEQPPAPESPPAAQLTAVTVERAMRTLRVAAETTRHVRLSERPPRPA